MDFFLAVYEKRRDIGRDNQQYNIRHLKEPLTLLWTTTNHTHTEKAQQNLSDKFDVVFGKDAARKF